MHATVTHADGSTTALTVEAPTVVVACGSIESPALLLRSGIGGPAVGKHLRLHPAYVVMGIYDEPVEGWRGQVQSLVSEAYAGLEGDFGFLIEATTIQPGFLSPALPWGDGATHKQLMQSLKWQAPFITVARDHGSGEVVLDDLGRAVMRWGLGDEVDARLAVRAHVELCRLHQAAGATEVYTTHESGLRWRTGDDFDAFLEQVEAASYEPNDVACFTAHQMGSCRMGSDPADLGGRRPRPAARHRGRVDRRRVGVPHRAGREPDDLDHGPGPPHRRAHRWRARRGRRVRSGYSEALREGLHG